MADNKQYRRTGDKWIANLGGCGCGGRKTTEEIAVDNSKLLVFQSIAPITYTPSNFPGLQNSYTFIPNSIILDVASVDYEVLLAHPSFRSPLGSEATAVFGMRMRLA